MKFHGRLVGIVAAMLGLAAGAARAGDNAPVDALPPAAAGPVDFGRDVRPILAKKCLSCHGPRKMQGGLRLHRGDTALVGGDSGLAFVPGRSAESRLIRYVAGLDEDHVMPPEGISEPLTPEQVGVLRAWIDAGAAWPADESGGAEVRSDHWAFRAPTRPEPPAVRDPAWCRNPIDAFVLAGLEAEGLRPSPEADRATWLRRVSLDLIGLPPTLEELDAFLADDRPDAHERQVDRLLVSPHYGERWARRWLDRARFADTNGYEKDRERPIWPYRDWVIRALNDDMPFNQFTIEQIAGDLLPGASESQRVATGFHRNTMTNEEGGIDVEEFRFAAVVDRVATTGAVWLGLTLGCAQCHTHKFDPITQREYYRLFALLNNCDEPELELADPAIAARRAETLGQIAALEAGLADQYPAADAAGEPGESTNDLRRRNLEASQAAWEATLRPVRWRVLRPEGVVSRKHATMTVLDDGSVRVGGDVPNNDVYELELEIGPGPVTGLRLEAMVDPSLPAGGPGRAPLFSVGDFLLTEFLVDAVGPGGARRLAIERASEDFAAKGREASKAVDGISDTGWSIQGAAGRPHAAVFALAEPIRAEESTRLRITMHQEYIHQMTLGRFRISATADPEPVASGLTAELEELALVPPGARSAEQAAAWRAHYLSIAAELAGARKPIEALQAALPELPRTLVMEERAPAHARTTQVHRRGEFGRTAEPVTPGVPAALHPLPAGQANRLALARWLVAIENPLTARVAVNNAWQAFFGRGLVATPDDFGTRGERPSHPELLDWLAVEYSEGGWSTKTLHRLIATSATYRQASRATPEQVAGDPRNERLGRGPRFRVDAEVVRDIALASSGLLSGKIGGPSVFPPQPEGVTALAYGSFAWKASRGEDRYRRGLYTFTRRTAPFAAFATMDAPSPEVACVRRERSNTPLQALTLLNDDAFVEAARALAARVLAEAPAETEARVAHLARLVLGRPPESDEARAMADFLRAQLARVRQGGLDPAGLAGPARPGGPDPREHAAWTALARVVLNLDEAITKE